MTDAARSYRNQQHGEIHQFGRWFSKMIDRAEEPLERLTSPV